MSPSLRNKKMKHKAKHKVKLKARQEEKRKCCRLIEIEEPVTWIRDLKSCKRIQKCTKSILKPAEKQLDITLTLDALENEIVSKRRQRPSSVSTVSTTTHSGKRRSPRLSFTDVSVFYFKRAVGQSSVPSDGTHPLGMGMEHVDQEKMKLSLYSSYNSYSSSRVTRQKTDSAKHNATSDKQCKRRERLVTPSSLSQISPPPPPPSPPSLSSSTTTVGEGKFFTDNNNRRERHGLFQQLCSGPGPRRMFSTSAISKLRSSPAFQRDLRDLPLSYRAGRSEFPWEPVREDGGGLATAFSAQLSVEDVRETLPQPEHSQLSDISSKCTQSFSNYHQTLQSNTEEEAEVPMKSSPTPRLPLRRSKRRLKEEGGKGGLKVLSAKARQVLLRAEGVTSSGRGDITDIQASRERTTGCNCRDGCVADCECSRNNIPCQLEYRGFPCSCLASCNNPSGRRVFDNVAVALHYINTMVSVGGVMDISERRAMDISDQPAQKRRRR